MTFQKNLIEKKVSSPLAAFTSSLLVGVLFLQTPIGFAAERTGCQFTARFKSMLVVRAVHYYNYKGFYRTTDWVPAMKHVVVCVQKDSKKPIHVIAQAAAGTGTYTYYLPNQGTKAAPDYRSITATCEDYSCTEPATEFPTCITCNTDDVKIESNYNDTPPLTGIL